MIDALPAAESAIEALTTWTRLALDAASVIVIGIGAVVAAAEIPSAIRGRRRFRQVRLDLARYLALALELQLASDILQTAIAPSWTQLGQLAAIAAIRTALNFFLAREMKEERAVVVEGDGHPGRSGERRLAVGAE